MSCPSSTAAPNWGRLVAARQRRQHPLGPGDLLGRGREGAVDRADLAGVDRRLAVEAELACALAAARQAVGIIQAHVRRVDGVDARGAAGQHDLALREEQGPACGGSPSGVIAQPTSAL